MEYTPSSYGAPLSPNQRHTAKIAIARVLLQETGSYNPMFARPYETYIGQEQMDNIARRVDQAKGANITGTLLAGIASNILHPSATPGDMVAIPNGWQERRVRFIMEVHVETSTGNSKIYYFQGYTSHCGVTANGIVDPRMELIINSFVEVVRANRMTPVGMVTSDWVVDSAQVINGQLMYNMTHSDIYAMRPQDIFTGIQSGNLQNAYNYTQGPAGFNDTRITVGMNSIRSNRSNNIPTSFIAKIADSYQHGLQTASFGQTGEDIIGSCRQMTYETAVQENVFIRAISNIRGVPSATTFTLQELAKIDPNVQHVTQFIALGPTQQTMLHSTGQTAYWNSADRETLFATSLSNAVPALMMELMISNMVFRVTNHDVGGAVRIDVLKADGLTNMPLTTGMEVFKRRLEREILFDLTFGNQELFMLEMHANLFGETRITIALNSGTPIDYATPSFCDGIIAPVISTNKDSFFGVVNDFEQLMNNIQHFNEGGSSINMTV